jgi:hypothetical protein
MEELSSQQVILLTFIAGVLGPSVLGLWITRALSVARQHDADRHVAVAARLEAVREATVTADAHAAEIAADNNSVQTSKLDQIHALVNSQLTEAQQRALSADRWSLALAREVVALKRERGLEPDPESLAVIEETQNRVDRLARELERRTEQTKLADRNRAADDTARSR